jgi:hypothetical protein
MEQMAVFGRERSDATAFPAAVLNVPRDEATFFLRSDTAFLITGLPEPALRE